MSADMVSNKSLYTHHDTKRKTQPRRQKGIAVFNLEVLLARELANDEVDAYYRCYAKSDSIPPRQTSLTHCAAGSLPPKVHAIRSLAEDRDQDRPVGRI
jgi:hypothetical protein